MWALGHSHVCILCQVCTLNPLAQISSSSHLSLTQRYFRGHSNHRRKQNPQTIRKPDTPNLELTLLSPLFDSRLISILQRRESRVVVRDTIKDVHATSPCELAGEKTNNGETYYASPPQMPSRAIRQPTQGIDPVAESGRTPTADSRLRNTRMRDWRTAGRGSRISGNGGIPTEMEEREKNTKVW